MKQILKVLHAAEEALQEGFDNCGQDADCIYAQPLAKVRKEILRLRSLAGDIELAAAWCSGDANNVGVMSLQSAARALRGL